MATMLTVRVDVRRCRAIDGPGRQRGALARCGILRSTAPYCPAPIRHGYSHALQHAAGHHPRRIATLLRTKVNAPRAE